MGTEITYQSDLFIPRAEEHDRIEVSIMNHMRKFTDRRHLPDRRVSFSQTPCSWDLKTNVFVESNSHDEYFRLWAEGEPVFIVYRNKDNNDYYADWIINLSWTGPISPSANSTSGDPYYRIAGGRTLDEFLKSAAREVSGWRSLGE